MCTKDPAGGRKAGAGNYSKDEVMHLLAVMDEILPIGQEEWEEVVEKHTAYYQGCDVNNVAQKEHSNRGSEHA